jgi:hypothetical protein
MVLNQVEAVLPLVSLTAEAIFSTARRFAVVNNLTNLKVSSKRRQPSVKRLGTPKVYGNLRNVVL